MATHLTEKAAREMLAQIGRLDLLEPASTYDVATVALEAVQEALREPSGTWFADWMMRHGLDDQSAADALGCRKADVRSYREGSRPIPRVFGLACAALSYGLPSMEI